ncbi:MAG: release factor glutamine methyltransferase [Methanothermococcus sp.]|jgi:release factor glutamine methyltransferase|uniref:HemK2/MTQ2 family protein methyltransferase n=1 Tax=Methanothermococcus TaxID=155862 RepID=UPI00036AE978|nr:MULTISPECIES: HemK2/MTQ2 family protein methyltransferase [Methanothermococcus]MDK2790669.1 release factor glutamine methyltransferase [Methanothermococcus sp.]MDK2987573.1 release factor glutamine methyltransferase [Methanothermococcus sp.]
MSPTTVEIKGILIKTHPKVYEPAEDSELLIDNLVDVKDKTVLDVGTGTGIQAINALKKGAKKVVGIDINPYSIETAKENAILNKLELNKSIFFLESDLFSSINERFDVILFNAPYLPTSEDEKLEEYLNYAFDGGEDGRKVLGRFIKEVGDYLNENGIVQIVQSSLTGEDKTIGMLEKYGFKAKKTGSMAFPFEELQVITGWRK